MMRVRIAELRRLILSTCFIFLCTPTWGQQDVDGPESPGTVQDGPRIQATRTEVDLGLRLYSESLEETFSFENVGTEELTLTVKKRSCGCVTDVISGQTVPPGEKGSITVGYAPDRKKPRHGLQRFTVILATNDPDSLELRFSVLAHLVRPVEISPAVLDFGELERGTSASLEFTVTSYRRAGAPRVESVTASSSFIGVERIGQEDTEEGIRFKYMVSLVPGLAAPDIRESIVIRTDSEELPILELPVRGRIRSRVDATPRTLMFGLVGADAVVERTVKLVLRRDEPVILATATCEDVRVVATLEPLAGGSSWNLVATFSPGSFVGKAKTIKSTVRVFDRTGELVTEVPLHAVLRAAGSG